MFVDEHDSDPRGMHESEAAFTAASLSYCCKLKLSRVS